MTSGYSDARNGWWWSTSWKVSKKMVWWHNGFVWLNITGTKQEEMEKKSLAPELHEPRGLINKRMNESCNNFFWTRVAETWSLHPSSPPMQLSRPKIATVVCILLLQCTGVSAVLRKMNFTRLTSEVDCHILDWETSDDTSLLSSCTAWTCTARYRRQTQLNLFIKQFFNTHHHRYLDIIILKSLLFSSDVSRRFTADFFSISDSMPFCLTLNITAVHSSSEQWNESIQMMRKCTCQINSEINAIIVIRIIYQTAG